MLLFRRRARSHEGRRRKSNMSLCAVSRRAGHLAEVDLRLEVAARVGVRQGLFHADPAALDCLRGDRVGGVRADLDSGLVWPRGPGPLSNVPMSSTSIGFSPCAPRTAAASAAIARLSPSKAVTADRIASANVNVPRPQKRSAIRFTRFGSAATTSSASITSASGTACRKTAFEASTATPPRATVAAP